MNKERDKFLTELIGEVYHDYEYDYGGFFCKTCNWESYENDPYIVYHQNTNFSSFEGFGKLWNWAYKEKVINIGTGRKDYPLIQAIMRDSEFGYNLSLINPDKFANAVYNYLKDV